MQPSSVQCFELRTESNVKVPAEHGKSAIFRNRRGEPILLVHADKYCRKGRKGCMDCFFEERQQVADYIVSKLEVIDVIVELKGTDLLGAVAQIEATIPPWRMHERCSGKIGALIVSSKGGSHPDVTTKYQVKMEQFKRRGVILRRSTDPNAEFEFSFFR